MDGIYIPSIYVQPQQAIDETSACNVVSMFIFYESLLSGNFNFLCFLLSQTRQTSTHLYSLQTSVSVSLC